MSNLDSWMPNNEEYLAKALAWLRWRLCEFAQLPDTEIAEVTEKPTTEGVNPLPALILLL
ncbi:MAG: hypothetical protein V7K27_22955 [Nostoc sp.]|uniref:hypothetical protein n=1 Tax=Nostoc sp. TaxID=1180 RepID=UPI002FF81D7E